MTRSRLIYIPVVLLFLFAMSVLVMHYGRIVPQTRIAFREANLAFGYTTKVTNLTPEAEAAGIRIGDRIHSINGDKIDSAVDLVTHIERLKVGETVNLVMDRGTDGTEELVEATMIAVPMNRSARTYATFITGVLYTYAIPTVAILLAFWVLFLRPRDPLAWALLIVLLGMSAISFELYPSESYVGAYRTIFYSSWALGMLLFGLYFPERWAGDRRLPWLKWILIIPLLFQVCNTLLARLSPLVGVNLLDYIRPVVTAYMSVAFYINLVAISAFFALLGYKSGTLQNADSRRRLRLLVWGTGIGMTPTFAIVLYQGLSGASGSFYEVVPFWFAVIALLLLNLFPLTLAYVIVVQQAMAVKVVVRQGLQYALARGGVRIIQMVLLFGIGMLVWWSINAYGASVPTQIAFIVAGVAMVPLVEMVAKPLRLWIDKRFFREAYNAEQILSELSEDVRTIVETEPLLQTVAARINESLHVPQVTLLLKDSGKFVPAHAVGFDSPPRVAIDDDSRAVRKLSDNKPILLYDDLTEVTSVPTISLDEREQLRELNTQLLLPLSAKNELSGIISLSPKLSEEPFTASDMRLLRSVATQTGFALENSRLTEAVAREAAQRERLNAEVEIAREVQERLFPQELPAVDGLDYYGACRPALGVGGDYYDFLELPDGKFGIAIGDVSGKGIGASLMMASLQASLRGQALHSGNDLAGLMSNVNTLVYEASTTNRYATFFYAQYDPKSRHLSYVNAGHNPPFLLRGDEVIKLETGGPVVGMLPSMFAEYEQGEIGLMPGDMLVGFTDGISEAMNPEEEEWGEDALLEELKPLTDRNADDVLRVIVEAADRFAAGANQHDDMTMVVVSVLATEAQTKETATS